MLFNSFLPLCFSICSPFIMGLLSLSTISHTWIPVPQSLSNLSYYKAIFCEEMPNTITCTRHLFPTLKMNRSYKLLFKFPLELPKIFFMVCFDQNLASQTATCIIFSEPFTVVSVIYTIIMNTKMDMTLKESEILRESPFQ